MNTLRCLVLVLLAAGCFATTPRSSDGTTPVQRGESCVSDSVKDKAGHLVDNVASAVATGDYKSQLDALAVSEGLDVIKCATDFFISSMTGRKAEADSMAAAQLQRAQAWRSANP